MRVDEGPFWRSASWKRDFGYQVTPGERDPFDHAAEGLCLMALIRRVYCS